MRPRTARRRYRALYETIDEIKPARILEIGVETGDNAAAMIARAGEVEYFGVDIALDRAVEKRLAGPGVRLYRQDSTKLLPYIWRDWPKMDLIFIDGGHDLETQEADWANCVPLMHGRTVVFMDDYFPRIEARGCKALINRLKADERYDVRVHAPIDVTVKGKRIAMASVRAA